MKRNFCALLMIVISLSFISCSKSTAESEPEESQPTNDFLTDRYATAETIALFKNLQKVAAEGVMFGHQDDTAYGVGWWAEPEQSDVKRVCGQYPAVYGFDLGDIHLPENLDGVDFDYMKTLIKQAFARNGVITISLHLDNPATDGNSWDNSPAIASILPDGANHEKYIQTLSLIAAFLKDLKTDDGIMIPVILRPYHEHNHTWSWWGKSACTAEEYNQLWKMTVEYFRDEQNIHHLLYAISPQDTNSETEYFSRYPGDEWVDVLGLDYYILWDKAKVNHLGQALAMVSEQAQQRNKVAALTETGIDKIPIADWWTEYLLAGFKYSDASSGIAWSLVWRNYTTEHHFAPFPGHKSAPNFISFYNDALTLFQDDIPDMYTE